PAGIQFAQLLQAVMVLSGSGVVLAVQDDAAIAKARKRTERLNTHLMTKARSSNELTYLASPVTGGGVTVQRFHQLFVLARQKGHKTSAEWAAFAWNVLAMQGQRLLKDGKALETPEENLAELTAQATEFADKQLPVLKALQIA
ncbi:MAG: methyltransferase, partial [Alcaligenaceae bacterium]|nr:methyltransferase [Alcaligenaceae bacterium]